MANFLYRGDLPDDVAFSETVAVDSETMGLDPRRDRLCVVQFSAGDGDCHLVQIPAEGRNAPNLIRLLADRNVLKLFHFARFDIAALSHGLGVECTPRQL